MLDFVKRGMGTLKTLFSALAVSLLGVGMAVAQETGTDVTAITGAFTDASTGVGSIAAVMLGVVAAGIAVKWLLGFVIS